MTNQTPQSTFDEKLDEILFVKLGEAIWKGTGYAGSRPALQEAKEAITSLVLEEVVGKDDQLVNKEFHGRKYDVLKRNELRAQQRSIITKESK